ncbi:N-acetyl-gamma-glutamyl-phosphate reductase [Thermosulfidibacter takaii ABI70S6]|uniref:N-acetyl-gamma-glutamyl-phosphate reductase n=2 Tax=Thermosulfidibacter takaii TaxID=412593 RepID=A0A0S3QVW6_THET7|nr:N-acetyl-gamma-glutamyl-phosphate reductase [Thermosulfidibacter takaii ABI70S6]
MFKVAVVGATGYTGLELVRLLYAHPLVEVVMVTSESYAGQKFSDVFPGMKGICDLELTQFEAGKVAETADLAFVCLPHGASMKTSAELVERGIRVVDLSGDFRFKNISTYEKWYKVTHEAPGLCEKAVYGLPEIFRDEIANAQLVANPGCYATSVILALYPLVKKGYLRGTVIADCKSGVTGGGRKLNQRFHFPECNESFMAYSVEGHRHNPEMEEVLIRATQMQVSILFVPHLVPMNRGILSTLYVELAESVRVGDVISAFDEAYSNEPFVRVYPYGQLPSTKDVRGSNFCDIGFVYREDLDRLIIISAIDNLVKGASGQAAQNMNVMLNLDEGAGLQSAPLWV